MSSAKYFCAALVSFALYWATPIFTCAVSRSSPVSRGTKRNSSLLAFSVCPASSNLSARPSMALPIAGGYLSPSCDSRFAASASASAASLVTGIVVVDALRVDGGAHRIARGGESFGHRQVALRLRQSGVIFAQQANGGGGVAGLLNACAPSNAARPISGDAGDCAQTGSSAAGTAA